MQESRDNDIVILVGGRPAGLTLEAALGALLFGPHLTLIQVLYTITNPAANKSLSIALIEAGDLPKIQDWGMPSDAYSNCVSCITDTSPMVSY